jgi:hypothetical protein
MDEIIIDSWGEQVLMGTILGGSSLIKPSKGKNYFLSMRSTNHLWISWKASQLFPIFNNKFIFKDKNTYRIASKCCPFLTNVYQNFYQNNKRYLSIKVLDSLRDIGVAVWFLEDGGRIGRNKKNAYLNCKKYGIQAKDIETYFNQMNIKCKLSSNRIIFSVQGTQKLFKIIAHRFPDFMHYHLENL